MKTYHITYTEINRYPVEIEANSREEAQGKLYDNFSEYIDILRPDDTEIELEFAEEAEPNEKPLKEYEIVYWEKLATKIVIPAHTEEEAEEILERDYLNPGVDLYDLECVDSSWTLVNPD